MPKAPINKNYRLMFRQNYVGFAGQIMPVKPKAVTHLVHKRSNHHLGAHPFRPHLRHTVGALGRCHDVSHLIKTSCVFS